MKKHLTLLLLIFLVLSMAVFFTACDDGTTENENGTNNNTGGNDSTGDGGGGETPDVPGDGNSGDGDESAENGAFIVAPIEAFTFTLNGATDTYSVTDYKHDTANKAIIPEEYNGKKVTAIGDSAFEDCTGLTSITIPSSVTSIGDSAFEYCTGLTSITFEDTTTWYRTTSFNDFENKTGGTETDLSIPENNATYFVNDYQNYRWYKL